MPFDSLALTVRRATDSSWDVLAPLVYRGERETFVVPPGFRTDFASVPRVVVWLFPRSGRYTPAAVPDTCPRSPRPAPDDEVAG
ncbi:DUF1353 domain-containing protein [Modestobacter sp. KNN46-3]|uniref:DUF1353 domain-containing protein n=1 Tax=Modestobacter sp. KNN46-3 TaxID=2711218 RepID=UPI0013E040D5|nr:DUF1353 domain-containing protein [Modestobacter sp. KNN46-3]